MVPPTTAPDYSTRGIGGMGIVPIILVVLVLTDRCERVAPVPDQRAAHRMDDAAREA